MVFNQIWASDHHSAETNFGQTSQPNTNLNTNKHFAQDISAQAAPASRFADYYKNLGWIGNFVACSAYQSLKSIKRANLNDALDQLSMGVTLAALAYTTQDNAEKIFGQDSSIQMLRQACVATAKTTLEAGGLTLLWGAQFFARHHLARKFETFGRASQTISPDKEPLVNTNEACNLDEHQLQKIQNIYTQFAQAHLLSDTLKQGLLTECYLGNWQVNSAFEAFNENAALKLPFQQFSLVAGDTLAKPLADQLIQAVQVNALDTIKKLLPLINQSFIQARPEAPSHSKTRQWHSAQTAQIAIAHILNLRSHRNIACFLGRLSRENRTAPTHLEARYLNQWLEDSKVNEQISSYKYADANSHFNSDLNAIALSSPSIEATRTFFTAALQQLTTHAMPPQFKLHTKGYEADPADAWTKSIEHDWMNSKSQRHDHKLHNIEALPQQGRVELVFNHSLNTVDMAMALSKIDQSGHRVAGNTRMAIDEALMGIPIVGPTLQSASYRLAEKSSFIRLLTNEDIVGVAPGGAREGLKTLAHANVLMWQHAKGFVRSHIVTGAPLASVLSPQVDQIRRNILPQSIDWLQKTVFDRLKIPLMPIIFAPWEQRPVRLDHFIDTPFEALPLPKNNLSMRDKSFHAHVSKAHEYIVQTTQERLYDYERLVKAEGINGDYPMAYAHKNT